MKIVNISDRRKKKEKKSDFLYDDLVLGAKTGLSVAIFASVYAGACIWMILLRSFVNMVSCVRKTKV